MTNYSALSIEKVLYLHDKIIVATGGKKVLGLYPPSLCS